MKEEKTKSKKRLIYYLVLAVSVLLLITATVLTVYFVTNGANEVAEVPPQGEPGDNSGDEPAGPGEPVGPQDPDEPTTGETVRFIAPVENATYTMEYSQIYNNKVLRWYYRHRAIDYSADEGAAVRAMSDGVVETIYERPETGKYIVVDHGDGIKSTYRFIEIKDGLKVGDKVAQGDVIGEVAAAYGIEKSDGTHLHLEMKKDGKFVNPLDYIDAVFDEK